MRYNLFIHVSLLLHQPRCFKFWKGVCVSVRVWYEELFLGIPNVDEEGGWIQTASISGPQRHPEVAWKWRREGGVKTRFCIEIHKYRFSINGPSRSTVASVTLTLNVGRTRGWSPVWSDIICPHSKCDPSRLVAHLSSGWWRAACTGPQTRCWEGWSDLAHRSGRGRARGRGGWSSCWRPSEDSKLQQRNTYILF